MQSSFISFDYFLTNGYEKRMQESMILFLKYDVHLVCFFVSVKDVEWPGRHDDVSVLLMWIVFLMWLQDFGDYSDSYYSVQTTEGEQISQLIAGYIDIILKKVGQHCVRRNPTWIALLLKWPLNPFPMMMSQFILGYCIFQVEWEGFLWSNFNVM